MNPVTTIVGLSGSLRRDSFNSALLRAAAAVMPDGAQLVIGALRDVPLYDGDVEAQGIPPAVAALKDAIAGADGLLLASPEYNNSLPGVLKNVVDWLSRPSADIARVFRGKPVAVMGASPGGFGTILAQDAWLPVLRTLGTQPWFGGRMLVSRAGSVFGPDGAIVDAAVREQLQRFVHGFVAFVRS